MHTRVALILVSWLLLCTRSVAATPVAADTRCQQPVDQLGQVERSLRAALLAQKDAYAEEALFLGLSAMAPDLLCGREPRAAISEGFIAAAARLRRPRLLGNHLGVTAGAATPDGTRFATGSLDGSILVWDGRNLQPLLALTGHVPPGAPRDPIERFRVLSNSGHLPRIEKLTISNDGSRLLSVANDETVRLWDARSGDLLLRIETSRSGDAVLSPDGAWIAVGNRMGLQLYDARSGKLVRTLAPTGTVVKAIAFSYDSRFLGAGNRNGSVELWSVDSDKPVSSLSPDAASTQVVERLGSEKPATRWDPAPLGSLLFDSSPPIPPPPGLGYPITAVAFSPDGSQIAVADQNRLVRLWEVATARPLLALTDGSDVGDLKFAGTGELLVGGPAIRLWQIAPARYIATLPGWIESRAFLLDDQRIVIGGGTSGAVLFDLQHSTASLTLVPPSDDHESLDGRAARAVAFSADGSELVAVYPNNPTLLDWLAEASGHRIVRWDARSGTMRGVSAMVPPREASGQTPSLPSNLQAHTRERYFALGLANQRQLLVAAGTAIFRWDLAPLRATPTPIRPPVRGKLLALMSDGRRELRWQRDEEPGVREVISGKLISRLRGFPPSGWATQKARFSPDGHLVLLYHQRGLAELWNADSGQRIATLMPAPAASQNSPTAILSAADRSGSAWEFSADSKRVLAATTDGTIDVYDARNGQLISTIGEPGEALAAVASSHDSHRLAGLDLKGTVHIWDAMSGRLVLRFAAGGADDVNTMPLGILYSPDGRHIAVSYADGSIRVHSATLAGWIEHGCQAGFRAALEKSNQLQSAQATAYLTVCKPFLGLPQAPPQRGRD